MRSIAGLDVVALQVEGYVLEGDGVSVNIKGADGAAYILACLFGLLNLAEEVLREIGGCCIASVLVKADQHVFICLCFRPRGTYHQMRGMRPRACTVQSRSGWERRAHEAG